LDEYQLSFDWRGFELHPETPEGGIEMSRRFGARAEQMRDRITQFAASFGVHDLNHPERLPNTRRALAIGELARDRGLLHPYRESAMRAHWRDGLDLEKDEDLAVIARRAGLDPDEALAASRDPAYLQRIDAIREEAHALGVDGIPTFIFNGELAVVGCQPYPILAGAAEEAGAQKKRDAL
jgi:predicted DsbA family dithiol-disulfide isomerase